MQIANRSIISASTSSGVVRSSIAVDADHHLISAVPDPTQQAIVNLHGQVRT
jgi:hypothetical protein